MRLAHSGFIGFIMLVLAVAPSCRRDQDPTAETGGDGHGHGGEDEHHDEVLLSKAMQQRWGVTVATATSKVITPTFEAPGRVAFDPDKVAHVGSPVRGRIAELKARLGDEVAAGDTLLIVESPELAEAQSDFLQKKLAADAARPKLALAKSLYDRAKDLLERDRLVAQTDVERAELEYRAAEAEQRAAEAGLDGARRRLAVFGMTNERIDELANCCQIDPRVPLVAPIDGVVVEREVTLREQVLPERESLLVVADPGTLWVLADVPEMRLRDVVKGAPARVTIPGASSEPFAGTVTWIAAALDVSTRTAEVRIEVSGERGVLRPGMFVHAEIAAANAESGPPLVAVPEGAVLTVEGKSVVFVPVPDEPDTFAPRPVAARKSVAGEVPILSGLSPGEPYVAAGAFILKAELGKGAAEHQH